MGRPAALKVDIIADARKVGSGVAEAEGKLGKLGSAAGKVGKLAAGGLAVAAAAAGKFAYDSVQSASRVQQSFGALETIYGRNARQVRRWAAGAADSVGLAKSEYAELAGLVGSQLQNMGLSQEASAKRSNKLIKLGADLAATYGGSVADAVGAVSSLMKGEADPIERYGVSIKASDVSARLAAQGLDNLTGKAQKQAQATALLSLLNEQTAKTTGAFRKESSTLAGQQERLRAKFENVKATVGAKLIPVVTKLFVWMNDKLGPASRRIGEWWQKNLGPIFRQVARIVTGTLVPAARALFTWFMEKIAPGLRRALTPVLAGLRKAWGSVADAVENNRGKFQKLFSAIKPLIEFLANKVLPLVGKALGKAFEVAGKSIGAIIDIIANVGSTIATVIDKVRSLIDWISKIKIPDIDIPGLGRVIGRVDAGSSQLVAGGTYVDSRDLSVSVRIEADPLGGIDEQAVARRLGRLLDSHQRRVSAHSAPPLPMFGRVVARGAV